MIASRVRERRRLLHWLAEGKKLAELPEVEDGRISQSGLPDLERLDERLSVDAALGQQCRRPSCRNWIEARPPQEQQSRGRLLAPRCGANTRAGTSCRQPAMPNGRCRFHGGKSTGPRTAAGLQRSKAARLTHGFRTAEIIDLRSAAARIGRNLQTMARAHAAQETHRKGAKTQR